MVGDDISFSLELQDAANVSKVQLFFRVEDGDVQTLDMSTSNNLNYSVTVPALTADGELYYYFKLTDNSSNEVLLPDDALEDPYDMTITSGEVPILVINEILASSQFSWIRTGRMNTMTGSRSTMPEQLP